MKIRGIMGNTRLHCSDGFAFKSCGLDFRPQPQHFLKKTATASRGLGTGKFHPVRTKHFMDDLPSDQTFYGPPPSGGPWLPIWLPIWGYIFVCAYNIVLNCMRILKYILYAHTKVYIVCAYKSIYCMRIEKYISIEILVKTVVDNSRDAKEERI